MIILLSPAKRLDFSTKPPEFEFSEPEFLDKSEVLADVMKRKSPRSLSKLQGISMDLAQLNYERFQQWEPTASRDRCHPSAYAFKGDAYQGLAVEQFDKDDMSFAQKHLRILSGLYGILRPLDLIMPYRLEMGTALKGKGFKSLYDYWKEDITTTVKRELEEEGSGTIINLASDEYFKALDTERLGARIIRPIFKEFRNGEYKFLSYYGKRSRGLMTSYIIRYRITDPEKIKEFREEDYLFDENLSDSGNWVFTR